MLSVHRHLHSVLVYPIIVLPLLQLLLESKGCFLLRWGKVEIILRRKDSVKISLFWNIKLTSVILMIVPYVPPISPFDVMI